MGTGHVRYEWIDLLRGIAVVGMIWTHAANTFLDASLQDTQGYRELSFYHGLIAPMFFWLAGYMRGLSAAKPGPRKPAGPTVKRLLMILAIGYSLHLPYLLAVHGDLSIPVLRVLLQSDVLQCLAVSCLLLLALERGLPRALDAWAATAIGLLAILFTPTLAATTTGLIPLDAYLSKQHGSLFPLFPWVGFAC
ncbi:MAG: Acyltransferase domain protein, partial [Verrucomicrobiaceae bacterium]|nr:Acyltransferase domain protein [Verrucomicrobiaceae bacterium]